MLLHSPLRNLAIKSLYSNLPMLKYITIKTPAVEESADFHGETLLSLILR